MALFSYLLLFSYLVGCGSNDRRRDSNRPWMGAPLPDLACAAECPGEPAPRGAECTDAICFENSSCSDWRQEQGECPPDDC